MVKDKVRIKTKKRINKVKVGAPVKVDFFSGVNIKATTGREIVLKRRRLVFPYWKIYIGISRDIDAKTFFHMHSTLEILDNEEDTKLVCGT